MEHGIVQYRARLEVCCTAEYNVREEALREVPQVGRLSIGRDVVVDGDVAAVESVESLFIELYHALASFTKRSHGWVEGDDVLLSAAVELHVIQSDVCHPCMADLVKGLLFEGLEIPSNLTAFSIRPDYTCSVSNGPTESEWSAFMCLMMRSFAAASSGVAMLMRCVLFC